MEQVEHHHILTEARIAASNEYFQRSFDLYLGLFHKNSRMKKRLEYEFRAVLMRLNENLIMTDDRADIFSNFECAINIYPGNVNLLNEIGKYFCKYGYYCEALCHFEKAINIDASIVSVEKNLNNVKRILFPNSYFRSINDKRLNVAYRKALKESINAKSDSVLDTNAGPGLLTLYASECYPISTMACDNSLTMVKLAESVMQENLVDEPIFVNTPTMTLDHTNIYGTRTLLLTNMFDAGLFGEYLLYTLSDAWKSLLSKGARVLPKRAEYFVVGVNCDQLYRKYQLHKDIKKYLNIGTINVHTSIYYGNTYHEEDVNMYKDLKYVTEPVSLLDINFNDSYDVDDKLYPKHVDDYKIDIKVTEDSEVTNLIGWFNLYLTDNVMITTDPRSEERIDAWHQAVFLDFLPKTVAKGETVKETLTSYGGRLSLLRDLTKSLFRITRNMLMFLNDRTYIAEITNSMSTICIYLGQIVDISETEIVDLSPFPIFGLEMLKRGAKHLICNPKNCDDQTFIETVLKMNNLAVHKVQFLLADQWSHEIFKNNKYHAIFANILDLNGDVDIVRRRFAIHLQHAHLVEGGLFLPFKISVIGQLIYNKRLDIHNRVYDENVGYKIAAHVNRYQVSQANNLNLTQLDFRAKSDRVLISKDCYYMRSEVVKVPVIKDGKCNAIISWYEVQLLEGSDAISTYRADSFVENSAFLVNPPLSFFKGDEPNIIRCVDPDGSYKLVLDGEI